MGQGFSKLDNPSHEGNTNTWLTPLTIVRALGDFELDPCAFPGHQTAKKLISLPEDGLAADWSGRVWLNPPYGRQIGKWLDKLEAHGDGVALIFNRTDTTWFQKLKPDAIFFLKGRIKFLKPDMTEGHNAGAGSVFLIYGQHNVDAVLNSNLKGKLFKGE